MTHRPHHRTTSHSKGLWAEAIATAYLRRKKYQILETRYKTRYGEIDIIAKDKSTGGHTLVFIEVKARPSEGEALHAVTPRTQKRITQAAYQYLAEQDLSLDQDMRFDVIAIIGSPDTGAPKPLKNVGITLKHLDNAWMGSP